MTPKRIEWQRSQRNNSTSWSAQFRYRRLQLRMVVHRHSGVLPDRWVFQPCLVWDRR